MTGFVVEGLSEGIAGSCHRIASTYATLGTDDYNRVIEYLADYVTGVEATSLTEVLVVDGELQVSTPKAFTDKLAIAAFNEFGPNIA